MASEKNLEEKLKVENKLNSLEKADYEIEELEKKLIPVTIFGGFVLLSLIPLGSIIGNFFYQRTTGAMIGTGLSIATGFYWIKNVNRWFYEPITKKYGLSLKEWEIFYLQKKQKI